MNKMKLQDMTCCSWHNPRNAIVNLRTGALIAKEALDRIPNSPAKEHMIYSGNMCDPCAKKLLEGTMEPKSETIKTTASE
ncbi:MAG: hypothetical protein V1861_04130 [Candidatus Micrarchaeota archaeon]